MEVRGELALFDLRPAGPCNAAEVEETRGTHTLAFYPPCLHCDSKCMQRRTKVFVSRGLGNGDGSLGQSERVSTFSFGCSVVLEDKTSLIFLK